jgi:hypothetical protein
MLALPPVTAGGRYFVKKIIPSRFLDILIIVERLTIYIRSLYKYALRIYTVHEYIL